MNIDLTRPSEFLLTEAGAASLLQVTRRCLQGWRHKGGGPIFVRLGRKAIRYRRVDLERFVEERLAENTVQLPKRDH